MSESLEDWNKAMLGALEELGTSTLGVDSWSSGELRQGDAPQLPGAFVALMSPTNSLQVGFAATRECCVELARLMLCLEPEDELEDADLSDAMGEIVNIVAGGVKTRMNPVEPNLRLGLPVFVDGCIEQAQHTTVLVTPVTWGELHGQAILIRSAELSKAA